MLNIQTLDFNEVELKAVAELIVKHNKYWDKSVEQLIEYMKNTASYQPGYISTMGFCLTTYKLPDGDNKYGVKATIDHILFK